MIRTITGMRLVLLFIISIAIITSAPDVCGQESEKKYTEEEYQRALNQLDPRSLNPAIDPDIDMYLNNWKNSIPFNSHGSITERAILTKCDGDPLKPKRKGEVLNVVNRLSRATLDPYATTTSTTLKGEQEIFYIMSGKGVVKAGKKTAELRKGAMLMMPEGLEFTMTNKGDEMLIMYLINEPVPKGFTPKKEFEINYEDEIPLRNEGYIQVHWSHNGRAGISGATLGTGRLIINAMTIAQPHSHDMSSEEVWLCTEGKLLELIGKEIRWLEPGTAFRVPPTGYTPHGHINPTEEPARFLIYIARPPKK